RQPSSSCPGVPVYWSWEHAAADGLHTQTQWRGLRRRVAKDARPVAVFPSQRDWYWLYTEAQTVAMREASPAQRDVLERGRRTQRTCSRCGREYEYRTALNQRGICYNCVIDAQERRARARDEAAHAEARPGARER